MSRKRRHQPPEQQDPPDDRPALSPRKRRVFIAIVVLLPFAALALTEGVLRLCGIGGYPPVIKDIGEFNGAELLTTYIPGAVSYFDLNKGTPGSIAQYVFSEPKPPNTVRVFLAGGSAMEGYPQSVELANSAFLREMLSDVWPQRHVEVINLGTTAVASFPVLGMLTEALDHQPDLVVIYSGHNEFYGAYGVASLQSAGRSPLAIRFHRWLGSLGLTQTLNKFAASFASADDSPSGALMEVMARQGHVSAQDPLRDQAASNLRTHIHEMIRRCQDRGVPVIVCTLASNERDLAPIGTPDLSQLDPADRDRLNNLLNKAAVQLTTNPSAAIESLEGAQNIYPDQAMAWYLFGRAFLTQGEDARAAQCFRKAIDCDPMPWRAPSRSIEAIRAAAQDTNAVLCDVQQVFRDASPHGCTGWELMDDHVHFSLEGQALLARCIVKTLIGFKGPLAVDRAAFDALPDWQVYADRLGDNKYERYAVGYSMRSVFAVPFMKASNPGAFQRWDEFCGQLLRSWSEDIQKCAQEWQDPSLHHIVRRPLSGFVGRVMLRDKQYASARPLFEVAAKSMPLFSTWNIEYVYFALLCRYELAGSLDATQRQVAADTISRAEFLLGHGVGNPGLVRRFIGRLHQLRGEWQQSIPILEEARRNLWEMERVACDAALFEAYVRTHQPEKARALAEDGVAHAGKFADYYRQFLKSLDAISAAAP